MTATDTQAPNTRETHRRETHFDPQKYLTTVNGKPYIEVKWRLVWLRSEHPDAVVETELHWHEPGQLAVFRARVSLPTGAVATGWGSEEPGDFGDYLEKAESKSLGRALAVLGYGTQFCTDHEDGPPEPARPRKATQQGNRPQRQPGPANPNGATPRQQAYLLKVAAEKGHDPESLADLVEETYGYPIEQLTRRDASALIEQLGGGSGGGN